MAIAPGTHLDATAEVLLALAEELRAPISRTFREILGSRVGKLWNSRKFPKCSRTFWGDDLKSEIFAHSFQRKDGLGEEDPVPHNVYVEGLP
mmetsp:Transcript_26233/g.39883  ORF Transcript_26233/g.39883 Transcript_26233/m.39883 type:complete len:92 (-) Transcript_26233:140-415(-)|eukprot:CAMPEP_0194773428 /NCGR_PEP_ID=MMETSP0323_2-20130528/54834_1 /TAXON_ID=2866 ORGANISM="Crypthecodinium cohnii, Strain Seligo" /NCGR_SAMPLE_ID=MMETSP0323_2 /ASSEMBLY_ACC=CAM_ASM_000346 /LENGTH=91 /DNA_ID=CAMNT_0039708473 /DNA_START=321 /DNA_END=596 /DNA_ORIENTATION=+